MGREWILVRSQPNKEDWAVENIRRQGHDAYVPKYRDALTKRIRALFPSYVFALTDGAWYFLKGTFGVSAPIMVSGVPQKVPQHVIDKIKSRTDVDGLVTIPIPSQYKIGDPVRIIGGPFAQHLAVYQGQSPAQRVRVLLGFLGTLQTIQIDHRLIEAA